MTWLTVAGILVTVCIDCSLFWVGFMVGRGERIDAAREAKDASVRSVRRNIRAAEQWMRKEIARWN